MKTKLLFSLLLSFNFCLLSSQVPQGFNYQAIARDDGNNAISGVTLNVRIGILTSKPEVVYEAEYEVKTNIYGLFQLVIGDPLATPVVGSFKDVDWSVKPLYIRTQIYWKGEWVNMGSAELFSVPYALVSQSVSGLNSLSVRGETDLGDSALFEVKNNLGKTVFAVYNEGVRVSVGSSPGKGATKGGFAIGGFGIDKTDPQAYLKVYPDSTRVYVNEGNKGNTKGGFAIGGFGAKGESGNYLDITRNNYFIGHETGTRIEPTGLYNSVIGYMAARNLTTGKYNTVLGYLADSSLTSGNNNIIIGVTAGYKMTTGNHNTLIGSGAGFNHTSQQYNVMIGTTAGYNVTGSFNTFMGINAGYKIKNGINNTFLGTNAAGLVEDGSGNTIIGIDAARGGATWDPYTYHTGYTTSNNTIVGNNAGYNLRVGSGNVYIGYGAGSAEIGTVGVPSSNKLFVSNSMGTSLIYGDFLAHKIGINTTTLNKTLNVGGDVEITGNLSAATVTATLNGNVSGNVTGNVSGNVTGNVIGDVNGVTIGKIFVVEKEPILSTAAGSFVLSWDPSFDGGSVMLENKSKDFQCNFWYKKDNLDSHESGSGMVPVEAINQIIKGTNIDNGGLEIHFGQADGPAGWCSVWLQFFNGKMVGHYIKN